MPIRVECDVCFKQYRVPDDRAGRSFSCKDCGNRITVPGGAGDDFDDGFEAPRATLPPPTARRPKKKSASRSSESGSGAGLMIGMSLLGLIVVGGVVYVGLQAMNGGGAGAPAAAPAAADGDPAAAPGDVAAAQPAMAQPAVTEPANLSAPANLSTPSNLAVTPSTPSEPVIEWTVQPDPVPAIEWPEHYTKKVKVTGDVSKMIYPSTPSQFAAYGLKGYDASKLEVVDLVEGKRVGRIQGQPAKFTKSALSPDGKLVAFHVLDNDVRTRVQVWSTETGQLVNELRCDEDKFNLSLFDFAGPGQLLTYSFGKPEGAAKFVHRLRIIDIETGNLVREMSDPIKVDANHLALSPGRRYLATKDTNVLLIYDLQEGRLAASQDISPGGSWSAGKMAFSRTGDRLAVLFNELEGCMIRVLDVSNDETLAEFSFSGRLEDVIPGTTYEGPDVEWLPGDVGWLLGGTLVIDAGSGRKLWLLKTAKNDYDLDNSRRRVPVADGFITVAGRDGRAQFERLRFEFDEAIATVAGVADDQEALLKPGMSVSIEVEAKDVRFGTPEETAAGLKEALSRGLEQDGFTVEDDQPVVLKVTYQEGSAGTFTQRKGFSPIRSEPTGKTVDGTMAAIRLEWRANKRKLWEDAFEYSPRILFIRGKELTDEAARDQMFKSLGGQLAGRPIAWYVGADGRRQLPVTVEIPRY
ncbi:MAG: WD40 repeat domain-containing protein [Maioricimonas sp. JB045]